MNKPLYFLILIIFSVTSFGQTKNISVKKNELPIGIFDSGTGGLTVLEAMLKLDQFNNRTGEPGADGKLDFEAEFYQYLADQANMPYGNYAAERKTDLLKEHILKNMQFLLGTTFISNYTTTPVNANKLPIKMIVVACNTATAYALPDIKKMVQEDLHLSIPVIGVIDAGSKAAIEYQKVAGGTIGVFATAGTVASNGYPRTLQQMAIKQNLALPSIVSQGGVGLAESIDRDLCYFSDTAINTRNIYKGPSIKNQTNKIDTSILDVYHFNKIGNGLLCEYDNTGSCTEMQLNDPVNYARYHLVSLLEKMIAEKYKIPLTTLILGCTHYPYVRDTIAAVISELYNYKKNGVYKYRSVLANHVELIDPAIETAKEAYIAMRRQQLQNKQTSSSNALSQFYITIPNKFESGIQLQDDGWFTYSYKYGRKAGHNKKDILYVSFDKENVSNSTYERFKRVLPNVYRKFEIAQILK